MSRHGSGRSRPATRAVRCRGGEEGLRFAGQDCPLAHMSQGVARRFWSLNLRFGWWGLPYLETLLRLADQYESANPNSSSPS